MYHTKKFSMTSLVPHKGQGAEPLAAVKNASPAASGSAASASASGGNGKQRLRWTSDLHDRFVDAITQLGGPDSGYYCLLCILLVFIYIALNLVRK